MTSLEELKYTEKMLKESEEIFRTLAEQSLLGIAILQDNFVKYVNTQLAQLFGYTVEETMNWGMGFFLKVIHPDDRKMVAEQAQKKQSGESNAINRYQFRGIKKNGDLIWLDVFSKTINFRGKPADFVTIQDITNEKLSEQKLRQSEEKFRTIFEAIPDVYFLVSEDSTVLEYRGKEQELYLSPEEFLNKKLIDLIPANIGLNTVKLIKKTLETKEPQIMEYELELQSEIHFFEARFFYFSKNQVSIFIRDISERKKAEKQISDIAKFPSENPNPVLRANKQRILYTNLVGKKLFNVSEGDKIPAILQDVIANVLSVKVPQIKEVKVNEVIYSFKITPIQQEDYVNIYGQNITEQKKSERALKIEKKFTEDIIYSSQDTIFVFDPETGKALRWNKEFSEVSGYSKEEISSLKAPESYYSAEDLKKAEEAIQIIFKEGKVTLEMSLITKDGKKIPYEYKATTLKEPGGKISIVSIGRDMTERNLAKQKLKESEERYRLISEASKTVVWSTDLKLNMTYVSSNSPQILGYTAEEALSLPMTSVLTPESFKKTVSIFKEVLRLERKKVKDLTLSRTYETEQIHKNGSIIPVEITFIFLRDDKSKISGILGISKDISERKEAEQKRIQAQKKLKKSYERLKEQEKIINNSPGVLFLWQNSEGWPVEFVSENVKQFGYIPEDFYSGNVLYEQIIHPDDLEKIFEEISFYSNEDISEFVQEYRIITKSGEIKWLDDRTWIRRNSEGNITHYQGIVIDITDRKATENALKLSESNYKDAYNMANFYKDLFTHDMNNILQIIQSSAEIISFQLGDSEKSIFIENMTNIIKSQIDRGSKLISDVRTLTSLDKDQITIDNIEITKFLHSSIKFVKKAYPDRKVQIFPEIFDEKYFTMANDLLQDVFENILINGIKYNENELVEININISRKEFKKVNYVRIQFIDNGIGVSDNKKELIFQPGNREIKGTKGMGIGLSLVSKIMEIFEGKIWVEDKVKGDYNQGSKFIVLLPETS
ncbi:MAG: PAS domain S-box protein [Promethearchaeota archaeon]